MHEDKQESFAERHLAGIVVFSLYFVLVALDYLKESFWT